MGFFSLGCCGVTQDDEEPIEDGSKIALKHLIKTKGAPGMMIRVLIAPKDIIR